MVSRQLFFSTALVLGLSLGWLSKAHADMVLVGSALKSFFAFPLVTVSLYVPDQDLKDDILSDIPKCLEVHYHVNIPKQELDRQTIEGISRNASHEELIALMPKIDQINSYYPDIKSGDRIRVTYIPGKGSQVLINGYFKGLVPGPDFARAFFSIWVGKNPVDRTAKDKLLGRSVKQER